LGSNNLCFFFLWLTMVARGEGEEVACWWLKLGVGRKDLLQKRENQ
jgi:hypothetical protein